MSTVSNHPLLPRHLKLLDLFVDESAEGGLQTGVDVVTGRRLVLGNGDVRLLYVVADTPSPYYRNAIGDECVYVERGHARLETVFGAFDVREGHYAIIPRATTHRWIPLVQGDEGYVEPCRLYFVEANSHITPPHRYLSRYGQLLEHSPFCERDYGVPTRRLLAEDVGEDPNAETPVYSKHRGRGPGGAFRIKKLPKRPETKEEEGGRRKCASGFQRAWSRLARQREVYLVESIPIITLRQSGA